MQSRTIEEAIAKIDNPTARKWFSEAVKIGKANALKADGAWPTVKPGTPEYEAWERYFDRLGWRPAVFRMARFSPDKEITVPTKYPEWFDARFADERMAAREAAE